MNCPRCGTALQPGQRVCPNCGAQVPMQQRPPGQRPQARPGTPNGQRAPARPQGGYPPRTGYQQPPAAPMPAAAPSRGITIDISIGSIVGMVGAVAAIVSLFLPWISIGENSMSFFDMIDESGVNFINIILILDAAMIIVCCLLGKRNAVLAPALPMLWIVIAIFDQMDENSALSFGFYIFAVGAVASVVSVFLPGRKR